MLPASGRHHQHVPALLAVLLLACAVQTFLWENNSAKEEPFYLSHIKTSAPWGAEVVRAMGANLLVCLAAWQAEASQDIISKIFSIFFPVTAFVAISFSHTIANMFWVS